MKGTQAAVWVDEFEFSAATSQIEIQCEVSEGERTSLASTAQEFLPILPKTTVVQNGYFEGVLTSGFEAELAARFAAGGAIVTVLVGKSDADCIAYTLPDAAGYEMTFAAPANNLVSLNGKWGTSASAVRGRRLFNGTFDALESGASVDFGAGSTNGGTVFLHVAAITGTATNATITVQSSPDNNTWSDEGAFVFSAVDGYALALAGVVGRYLRLACTHLGGATAIRCMGVASL